MKEHTALTVTKADLRQLAAQLRLAGELLEANGETAWATMEGWSAGPAASNATASHGNRVDDEEIPITIIDPTGDAAVEGAVSVLVDSYVETFTGLLDDLAHGSGDLVDMLRMATPTTPKPDKQHELEEGLISNGWCVSCFRDNRHLQPIETKPDGSPFYRGLCRWCGKFKSENRMLPPTELLRARHEGRRITVPMVQRALARKRKKKSRR